MESGPLSPLTPESPFPAEGNDDQDKLKKKKKPDARTLRLAWLATEKLLPDKRSGDQKPAPETLPGVLESGEPGIKSDKEISQQPAVPELPADAAEQLLEAESSSAPLEQLSTEEERLVAGQMAAERFDAAQAELDTVGAASDQAMQAVAALRMYHKLQSKLATGHPAERAVADAEAETSVEIAGGEDSMEKPAPPDETDDHYVAPSAAGGSPPPPSPPPPRGPGYGLPPPEPAEFRTAAAPSTGVETIPLETALYYEDLARTRGLLIGGIVGYLWGRRRGRIKAEKRLKPIQRKLEKQVRTLRTSLETSEQRVRQLAAEKAHSLSDAVDRQRVIERLRPAVMPTPRSAERTSAARPKPPEKLGKVVLEAPAVKTGAERPRTAQPELVRFDKSVEQYTYSELMRSAEKVSVQGASLRQMYESRRLDEKALRRVMTEFLRGGDVPAAVNRELLQRELSYERDPHLRPPTSPTVSAASSSAAVPPLAMAAPDPAGTGGNHGGGMTPDRSVARLPTPLISGRKSTLPLSVALLVVLLGVLIAVWLVS